MLQIANSQSIFPNQSREFCPKTEYTFTATIPKPFSSIFGVGGCFVTQYPISPVGSTFTFKGKFDDLNIMQMFRVIYTDNTQFDFVFKRIKSLFYGSVSCAGIQPNIATINAPICQIVNIPVSFANIQYGTAFESPVLCFGSIPDYEYLLPAGWSIGTTTSTGSNWITGGNSVTVTSDLGTGDAGVIRIRPSNIACGPGLSNGSGEKSIPISRPLNLGINGPSTICGTNATYIITGLPAGSSVTNWATNNSNTASVPNPSSGNSVVVTMVSTGVTTLTATVLLCNGQTKTVDKTIEIGSFAFGNYSYTSNSSVGNNFLGSSNSHLIPKNESMCFTPQIANVGLTNASWANTGGYPVLFNSNGLSLNFCLTAPSTSYTSRSTTFTLTATGPCGIFSQAFTFTVISSGSFFKINASPNPSNEYVNVTLEDTGDYLKKLSAKEIITINVVSIEKGTISKNFKFVNDKKVFNLNLSDIKQGTYILEVVIGKEKETKQIVIMK